MYLNEFHNIGYMKYIKNYYDLFLVKKVFYMLMILLYNNYINYCYEE